MDRETKYPAKGITFSGTIDKSKRTWNYEVQVRGLHWDTMCNSLHITNHDPPVAILCSGVANKLSSPYCYGNIETIAWGYIGKGPELLAVSLLTYSLGVRSYNSNLVVYLYSSSFTADARKHVKAFTKDIVSKLPDSWKMSAAEVLAWVDKQKQPTTPEVKHEREEQTK